MRGEPHQDGQQRYCGEAYGQLGDVPRTRPNRAEQPVIILAAISGACGERSACVARVFELAVVARLWEADYIALAALGEAVVEGYLPAQDLGRRYDDPGYE